MKRARGTRALLAAVLVAVALGATAMNGSVAAAAPAASQVEIVADPDEGEPPDPSRSPDEGEPPGSLPNRDEGEQPDTARSDEGEPPDTTDGGGEIVPDSPRVPPEPSQQAAPHVSTERKPKPPTFDARGIAAEGRVIVSFGPMSVPTNGETWRQWVNCPSGMAAISGGESNDTFSPFYLLHTGPYTPTTGAGWIVNVRTYSESPVNVTVYAVCESPANYHFESGAHATAPTGGRVGAHANCTGGRQLSGGGFWPEPNTVATAVTHPATFQPTWVNVVRNYGSGNVDVWPYAVCGGPYAGYTVVDGPVVTIAAGGGASSVTATCPASSPRLLGGGVWGDTVDVTDTLPASTSEWRAWATNNNGAPKIAFAKAICSQ